MFFKKEAPDSEIRVWWQNFYRQYDLDYCFDSVIIPDHQQGFNWVLIVPNDLTIIMVLEALQKVAEVFCKDCKDKALINDQGNSNDHYAVRFYESMEIDQAIKLLSFDKLAELEIANCNLLEKLLMSLVYLLSAQYAIDRAAIFEINDVRVEINTICSYPKILYGKNDNWLYSCYPVVMECFYPGSPYISVTFLSGSTISSTCEVLKAANIYTINQVKGIYQDNYGARIVIRQP